MFHVIIYRFFAGKPRKNCSWYRIKIQLRPDHMNAWHHHKLARYAAGSLEAQRAGTWLAAGWKGVLWALTGDLDYFVAMLGAPNYSLKSGPCMHCKCTGTGDLTWTNFSETALWRSARWDASAWHASPSRTQCVLLSLPGASCWTVAYDWVHVKYLGVDQYIFGSVLMVLVTMVMPGDDSENLQVCWTFLKNYFRTHRTPTPFRYLTKLTMFLRTGKYPKLRGKASEIRHFGKALLALWREFSSPHLVLHKRIALMLKQNVHLEDMITFHKEDFAFPAGAAQEFEETTSSMLQLLTQVADHFVEEGMKVFDITSKSHMLQELALLSRCMNPKVVWCFMGEDMMQRMQQVAKACVRGVKIDKQTSKLARHYRLGLHLHFRELTHWKNSVRFSGGCAIVLKNSTVTSSPILECWRNTQGLWQAVRRASYCKPFYLEPLFNLNLEGPWEVGCTTPFLKQSQRNLCTCGNAKEQTFNILRRTVRDCERHTWEDISTSYMYIYIYGFIYLRKYTCIHTCMYTIYSNIFRYGYKYVKRGCK